MSRAEMLVQWFSDAFAEVMDFFTYYASAGFDLWGDSALVPFVRYACICYALTMWWAWQEFHEPEESFFSRAKTAIVAALFFGSSAALISWAALNLLLGFFFGPVRP